MVFMLCLRECDPSYSRSSIANILFVNYELSVIYDSKLFCCETLITGATKMDSAHVASAPQVPIYKQ